MQINSAKDLIVYKKAFQLAMEIFHVSESFPSEEKYALTSQIRRSSRSISMNLRENAEGMQAFRQIEFGVYPEAAREAAESTMGQEALRGTLHQQVDRLRWRTEDDYVVDEPGPPGPQRGAMSSAKCIKTVKPIPPWTLR